MTPREKLETDLVRLVQEHPLFPLMVIFGLELLLRHMKSIPDNQLRVWFEGRFSPEAIKSDLQAIVDQLTVNVGSDDKPVS